MAHVVTETVKKTLKRRNRRNGPIPNQSHTAAVRAGRVNWAADLDGKANGLGEQNRNQNQNIFETCKERFHALA